jgi:hypothetical protein
MSDGKTAIRVLPMLRIRMSRMFEAVGTELRRAFFRWRLLWCLLCGRAARRAGTIACIQTMVVRRD